MNPVFGSISVSVPDGGVTLVLLGISISALVAHNKFANVDYKYGILLGLGGIIGAQIGARLVDHVSTANFKKIFAVILVGLAAYLFVKK